MYFFKKQGKQYLDLTGNLILSHNNLLVKARTVSAGPRKILHGKYIVNIGCFSLFKKIKATFAILWFIWGKPHPLLPSDTFLKIPERTIDRPGKNDLYG